MPGPLEGIKILELIRVPPGAFCTMLLADMGAEVLKIETPLTDASEAGAEQAMAEAGIRLFNMSTAISRVLPLI